jgi:hypothetical protein
MKYMVYWIRAKHHTDITSEGYVGITNNFAKRMWTHNKKKTNPHLKSAINKYGWENLEKSIILVGDENYCLLIEEQLRPSNEIGWNIVKGGGKPPAFKGNMSQSVKNKIALSVTNLHTNIQYQEKRALGMALSNAKIETKMKRSNNSKNLWLNQDYKNKFIDDNHHLRKNPENVMKGAKNGMSKTIKCVETNIIFETITQASKWVSEKINKEIKIALIARVVKNGGTAYGYHWEYA